MQRYGILCCVLALTGFVASAVIPQPVPASAVQSGTATSRAEVYYPSATEWETIEPRDAGWRLGKLKAVFDFAEAAKSSGLVIVQDGRIVAERYWQPKKTSLRYRGMIHGKTAAGHSIEDVASCQKSVTSILVGIAQQKMLLRIDEPVEKYLGQGWSKAGRKQESQITIRHLLTMTSGLNEQLEYDAAAGTQWKYNTAAYSMSRDAVCQTAKLSPNELTKKWITGPLGMQDSSWVKRRSLGDSVNKLGFATSARDLAKFGLMVLRRGRWERQTILTDQNYLKSALTRSQQLNPSYGYLWWLNSKRSRSVGGRIVDRPLISTAPGDLVGAFGALSRKCYVVPSLNLVVTRLGDEPPDKRRFQEELWRLIMAARAKAPAGL